MDWSEACRILGISESATGTEIKEQYLYKAQLLHPDKNQDKPENIRKKAEAELALVNQAYSFLNNPNNNPFRVPPKLAVEPMRIRFKDVKIGEKKGTTLTVSNAGGPYTSIWLDNNPAPWLTVAGVRSITNERLPLEVAIECQGTGEPGKQYACDLLIKLENEKTQALDQAAVKIELSIHPESSEAGIQNRSKSLIEKSKIEGPYQKSQAQSNQPDQMGFSVKTLVANLVAFAIFGVVLTYLGLLFFAVNEFILIVCWIGYIAISFGFSFNHAITVGSEMEKNKIKNKK